MVNTARSMTRRRSRPLRRALQATTVSKAPDTSAILAGSAVSQEPSEQVFPTQRMAPQGPRAGPGITAQTTQLTPIFRNL